ncbi:MAG: DNA gyrase subunit A [Candidatus Dadabacteria bacterium]|nr:DNA gyrase subunit A [Candidatus Dadabacteria bacterium]MYA48631.1 DNA gyrase subunit A [Candidatus Dadabacteria bacterium]MYK48741.1 DNA gyrase subunit A [Candidatus Dadabacteria bacterium]
MDTSSRVQTVNIEDEMKESYLSYSMSVIVGRALPDVRDGLKPVHRRILYGMSEAGNVWNRPYKKSARVVGDVMGKYHPHGDSAIYDSLVRMAQDFSMRIPLVDGQGNFGSVDGDSPAAMRYTEVRLSRISSEMLEDLDKETVEFYPNYDGGELEPSVLPTKVPNLLLNGSSGIAVGMSTNIPPHNLGELLDAVVAQIRDPNITVDKLLEIMPGPDFPTGGFVSGRDDIRTAYATGRGIVRTRARVRIEKQKKGGREVIIVTELPYQVNKARLAQKIAELVREEKIKGITDIRDESDREGIRLVIDVKSGEHAQVVLNQLYKHTQMYTSFGIIMLALVRNQPKVLSLKELLAYFIEHRKEVITRRTQYELRKAEERLHILEGFKIALDNLDEIVELIKGSESPAAAKAGLVRTFALSERQAQAILEMRLQRLTALERDKILEERRELIATVAKLREILESEKLILDLAVEELTELREKFGDTRRTEIVEDVGEISIEDLITDEEMVVTTTYGGYIKSIPLSVYRNQRRGGRGRTGMGTKDADFVNDLFTASRHTSILFFSSLGRCYWLKVYQIPEASPTARGRAMVNLLNLDKGEKVAAVLPVKDFAEDVSIVMATRNGIVKKTKLRAYSNPRVGGIKALNILEGDELVGAALASEDDEVLLTSRNGQAIRFKGTDVRNMGRVSTGVKGIRLREGDKVVSLEVIRNQNAQILTITEMGYGKCTLISEYRLTKRGGVGVKTVNITERNGRVVGGFQVDDDTEIMLISNQGGKIIRTSVSEIRNTGRAAQGVKVINLEPEELVAAVAKVAEGD